ncbi:MAG: hypothetical protein HYT21_03345 [Candidatus Nealsonbacteria bacterium]|nr:hypothetical protein [Candidatus Nealsonbacteria bacterium]
MAGLKEVVRGVVDLARGSTPPVETLQSVENPKLRQFLEAVEPQIKSITSWPFPGNRLADEFGDVLGRPRPRGRDADVYKWYNAVTGNGIIDFNYVPLGKSIRYSLTPDMLRAFAGFCWSYREWSEYSIGLGERIVRLREAFGEHPLGKLLNDPLKKSVGKPDEPAAQSPVEPAPVALLGDTGVFDGVADEAILAEPVTVEEEPVVYERKRCRMADSGPLDI